MYTTGSYPEISYNKLQYDYLSHSFVVFDWKTPESNRVYPDYFINAFNKVGGKPNPGDCYNWILGDSHANVNEIYKTQEGRIEGDSNTINITWGDDNQRASYANPYQGLHYNGSDLNWIYTLKSIGGKDSSDMPEITWPFNDQNNPEPWQSVKFGNEENYRCEDLVNWSWIN